MDETKTDDIARLTEAAQKLLRETERLRADLARLEARLKRDLPVAASARVQLEASPLRTVPEAVRAIGEATDAIKGAERDIQFLRSQMDAIWSEAETRREFSARIRKAPKR